jgi:hypothetical protein
VAAITSRRQRRAPQLAAVRPHSQRHSTTARDVVIKEWTPMRGRRPFFRRPWCGVTAGCTNNGHGVDLFLRPMFSGSRGHLTDRFRRAGRGAVRRIWASQTNERGEPLLPFEREALIERHCELFGTWPRLGSSGATVTGSTKYQCERRYDQC